MLFGFTNGSTCLHEAEEFIVAAQCKLNDSFLIQTHRLSRPQLSSGAHMVGVAGTVAFALSSHLLKQTNRLTNYNSEKQLD